MVAEPTKVPRFDQRLFLQESLHREMVKAEEPPVLLDSLEEEAKNDEESPENG